MSSQRQPADPAQRLVDTAVARIRRDGMVVGLDHISLEQVIAESGVSRATAYRHWPRKTDFLREVLVTVVRTTTLEGETPQEVSDLVSLLWERRDDLRSERGRRNLVVEGLRRSTQADFLRVLGSPSWRTYLALGAACQGLPEGELRDQVATALAETEARFVDQRAAVFARLPALFGYRLVAPLTEPDGFRVMSSAAGALMTGLIFAAQSRPELAVEAQPLAPFGSTETAEWTAPTLHLVRLFLAHLEVDPTIVWDAARRRAARQQLRFILDALAALEQA